jgi:hypothetical protein
VSGMLDELLQVVGSGVEVFGDHSRALSRSNLGHVDVRLQTGGPGGAGCDAGSRRVILGSRRRLNGIRPIDDLSMVYLLKSAADSEERLQIRKPAD